VRRSTTVRAGIAAALILALGLTGLAACSSGGSGDNPTGSATSTASATPTPSASVDTAADEAALAAVQVSGDAGAKPTLTLPSTPFAVTSQVARLVDEGSGDAVADGDLVSIDALAVSGADGSEQGNTWDNGAPESIILSSESFFDELYQLLSTAKVGGRILLAAPTSSATVVEVLEIVGTQAVPARATGEPVAPVAGLPTVTLADSGQPSLTAASGDAPTDLVVQPLIQGSGPAVTAGQTVVVHYGLWLWDGTAIESSWDGGTPYPVTNIGQASVIDGWNEGLVGVNVGSQVLLVVPPDKGYGDTASGDIPAGSTLVFVVDVLAAV
jgi:peptidylprolyl isomerase